MPSIVVHDNENFEQSLQKFKRACLSAGIVPEVRRREAYEKPTEAKKRAKLAARKRLHMRLRRERIHATRRV